MGWCTDHGLPHSTLLSWDEEDRAKLVAQLIERAEVCQGCGTAAWEWDEEKGGHPFAYQAGTSYCKGCALKEAERENLAEDGDTSPGLSIVLIPREEANRIRRKSHAG